jgi:hypothetical protein
MPHHPYDTLDLVTAGDSDSGVVVSGAPNYLRSDNGPEFIDFALQQWLRE